MIAGHGAERNTGSENMPGKAVSLSLPDAGGLTADWVCFTIQECAGACAPDAQHPVA